MNDDKSWSFTCKTCGGHKLTVTRFWSVLSGPNLGSWQEWGPLDADHRWHYEFQEKVEENPDDEGARGDTGMFVEDDTASETEELEIFGLESGPENDEYYLNCENCDRKIEFAWSQPNHGGLIFPVECSDFVPTIYWPESR